MNRLENPVTSDSGRSAGRRETISLCCEVRQGTRPWKKVLLEDLSVTGFRVSWLPGISRHQPLRIRIPGMQVLSAEIRWQEGDSIGCQFTSPLYVAVFEHLVRCSAAAAN